MANLLHTPTVQRLILEISRKSDDANPSDRALLFAIFFAAVGSLAQDECQTFLEESEDRLLADFL